MNFKGPTPQPGWDEERRDQWVLTHFKPVHVNAAELLLKENGTEHHGSWVEASAWLPMYIDQQFEVIQTKLTERPFFFGLSASDE